MRASAAGRKVPFLEGETALNITELQREQGNKDASKDWVDSSQGSGGGLVVELTAVEASEHTMAEQTGTQLR